MLTKSKISDSKYYRVTLKSSVEWGGKPRSPMHQYRLIGSLVKTIYHSCETITPVLIDNA